MRTLPALCLSLSLAALPIPVGAMRLERVYEHGPVAGFPGLILGEAKLLTISETGEVAMIASLREPGSIGGHSAVWRLDTSGSLTPILVSGDPAPGVPGRDFSALVLGRRAVDINALGQVAFAGTVDEIVEPGGERRRAIWLAEPDGEVSLVALAALPAGGGGIDDLDSRLALSSLGDVVFRSGRALMNGVWRFVPGEGVEPIAQLGLPFWGSANEVHNLGDFWANEAGDVAFSGSFAATHFLYLQTREGTFEALVSSDDPAPGFPGTQIGYPYSVDLNAAGEFAFASQPGETFLWGPDGAGGLAVVARSGDPVPEGPPGFVFGAFEDQGRSVVLGGGGDIAFTARLDGPPESLYGLLRWNAARGVEIIALSGDPVPGSPSLTFTDFFADSVNVNASGDVLFSPYLSDETSGLFLSPSAGQLDTIVREGAPLRISATDIRDVERVPSPSGDLPSQLNDAGQVVFHAEFTDGTRATIIVPEPQAPLLLLIGSGTLAAVAIRARRRQWTGETRLVTIPVEIREKLGLLPNSEVEFEVVGQAVRIRKVRRADGAGRRGKSIVERMRGRGSVRMTTDEIVELTRGER